MDLDSRPLLDRHDGVGRAVTARAPEQRPRGQRRDVPPGQRWAHGAASAAQVSRRSPCPRPLRGFVAHHNFVRIHGALRVTPAIEAGITDHVWSTDELVERALAALAEPAAPPVKKPLSMPETPQGAPVAPVRELPNGRGFLRLVSGGGETPKGPAPQPSPAAPAAPAPAVPARSRVPFQLSLFDDE
jgi:hypothetical protein